MHKIWLHEAVCTCPHCKAENTVVSSDLPANMAVRCRRCGELIGQTSDMLGSWIAVPQMRREQALNEQAQPGYLLH